MTEDGHTQIPNQIIEALMRINLSAYETRVLFLVIRQTLGWNKKEDPISFSQMAKKTGLDRRLAARAMKGLIDRKIVIKRDDSYINKYRFNKNFETWKDVISKDTSVYSDDTLSSKSMTKLSSIETPTKDNKDTYTKEIYSEIDKRLTGLLIELILVDDPKANAGRLSEKAKNAWINECRKLREIDKRTPEEIEAVIRWCQNDSFEKTVVLSMPKLRKRFDELFKKTKRETHREYKPSQIGKYQPPQYSEEEKQLLSKIDAEYKENLEKTMKDEGWESEEDIDYFKVPTPQEFRERRLREIKEGREANV